MGLKKSVKSRRTARVRLRRKRKTALRKHHGSKSTANSRGRQPSRIGSRTRINSRSRSKRGLRSRLGLIEQSAGILIPARLEDIALKAGFKAAAERDQAEYSLEDMRGTFNEWYSQHYSNEHDISKIVAISLAYRKGYALATKKCDIPIPLPLHGKASAIVSVSNEEKTISSVIGELRKLPLHDIIVVLNGCKDGSFEAIERDETTILVNFPQRLGHDVPRAIGSTLAAGDILLFVDGDMALPAEDLAPYLLAIDRGADIALNDLTPYLPIFSGQDGVTHAKSFLNMALGRSELGANSMTAVPHALSRRTIDIVGTDALIVPPKAQALAIARGLQVTAPHSVNVVKNNRIRSSNIGEGNSVAGLIVGDHLEALSEVMKSEGIRLCHRTLSRHELAKERNA